MENPLITILVSIATAAATALIAMLTTTSKLQKEFKDDYIRDQDRLRTMFRAESVALKLLNNENWKMRSFSAIKKRLGGFEDDELRQILVRAGAIRYEKNEAGDNSEDKNELWGLIDRNLDKLK